MAAAVEIRRIPDPNEPVPAIAWPTLGLLVGTLSVLFVSCWLALSGRWPVALSIPLNAVCAYLMFTVAHDATHAAASRNPRLNRLVGRIATPFFAPQASFSVLRFIHMQHHRFTNHEVGVDPDAYTLAGPLWQRPLRWLSIDLHYLWFYSRHLPSRPRKEKRELAIQLVVIGALLTWAVVAGFGLDVVLLMVIPQRLAIAWLAFAFDYLPHHGLHLRPSEDRFKTTRNRIGAERLLTPLLLYQNYHLVHHLHPVVPFYRYLRVWRRYEEAYLDHGPALSTAAGRPLTVDEYREIRRLARHEH